MIEGAAADIYIYRERVYLLEKQWDLGRCSSELRSEIARKEHPRDFRLKVPLETAPSLFPCLEYEFSSPLRQVFAGGTFTTYAVARQVFRKCSTLNVNLNSERCDARNRSFDGGSFKKNLSSNKYHFFPLLNNFLPNAYELSYQPRILLDIFFLSIFFLRRISKIRVRSGKISSQWWRDNSGKFQTFERTFPTFWHLIITIISFGN